MKLLFLTVTGGYGPFKNPYDHDGRPYDHDDRPYEHDTK